MARSSEFELSCSRCGWSQICGPQQILSRLRAAGVLRRVAEPDPDLVVELLHNSAGKFVCDACQHLGLQVRVVVEQDWPVARACQICGRPIPAERLEVFPKAVRCAACEAGATSPAADEREFCSRCGEVMALRLARHGGISRYEMRCPRCKT